MIVTEDWGVFSNQLLSYTSSENMKTFIIIRNKQKGIYYGKTQLHTRHKMYIIKTIHQNDSDPVNLMDENPV